MAFCELLAPPGEQRRASYFPRMAPVTFRLLLIQTRVSRSPRARRRAVPEMVAFPVVPATVTEMIRPEPPRWAPENPVTVPMDPVCGASFVVRAAPVKLADQVRTGLSLV